MTCKNICEPYVIHKRPVGGYYPNGIKKCNTCVIFIAWEGNYCPCCGIRLAVNPRNKKASNLKEPKRY